MQRTQISVNTPTDFNFGFTVNSYGWERLELFSLNREHQVLTRIERLPSQLSHLEITHDDKINVTVHTETKILKSMPTMNVSVNANSWWLGGKFRVVQIRKANCSFKNLIVLQNDLALSDPYSDGCTIS